MVESNIITLWAFSPISISNKGILRITLYTVIIDCFCTSENRKKRVKEKIATIFSFEPECITVCKTLSPFL